MIYKNRSENFSGSPRKCEKTVKNMAFLDSRNEV